MIEEGDCAVSFFHVVPARGSVEVNGVALHTRDGAAIYREAVLRVHAIEDSELVSLQLKKNMLH